MPRCQVCIYNATNLHCLVIMHLDKKESKINKGLLSTYCGQAPREMLGAEQSMTRTPRASRGASSLEESEQTHPGSTWEGMAARSSREEVGGGDAPHGTTPSSSPDRCCFWNVTHEKGQRR